MGFDGPTTSTPKCKQCNRARVKNVGDLCPTCKGSVRHKCKCGIRVRKNGDLCAKCERNSKCSACGGALEEGDMHFCGGCRCQSRGCQARRQNNSYSCKRHSSTSTPAKPTPGKSNARIIKMYMYNGKLPDWRQLPKKEVDNKNAKGAVMKMRQKEKDNLVAWFEQKEGTGYSYQIISQESRQYFMIKTVTDRDYLAMIYRNVSRCRLYRNSKCVGSWTLIANHRQDLLQPDVPQSSLCAQTAEDTMLCIIGTCNLHSARTASATIPTAQP